MDGVPALPRARRRASCLRRVRGALRRGGGGRVAQHNDRVPAVPGATAHGSLVGAGIGNGERSACALVRQLGAAFAVSVLQVYLVWYFVRLSLRAFLHCVTSVHGVVQGHVDAALSEWAQRVTAPTHVRCDCGALVSLVPPAASPDLRPALEAAVMEALGGDGGELVRKFRAAARRFYRGEATAHALVDITVQAGLAGGDVAALIGDGERRAAFTIRWAWAVRRVLTPCCASPVRVYRGVARSRTAHWPRARCAGGQLCFRCGTGDHEECEMHAEEAGDAKRCPTCNMAIGKLATAQYDRVHEFVVGLVPLFVFLRLVCPTVRCAYMHELRSADGGLRSHDLRMWERGKLARCLPLYRAADERAFRSSTGLMRQTSTAAGAVGAPVGGDRAQGPQNTPFCELHCFNSVFNSALGTSFPF